MNANNIKPLRIKGYPYSLSDHVIWLTEDIADTMRAEGVELGAGSMLTGVWQASCKGAKGGYLLSSDGFILPVLKTRVEAWVAPDKTLVSSFMVYVPYQRIVSSDAVSYSFHKHDCEKNIFSYARTFDRKHRQTVDNYKRVHTVYAQGVGAMWKEAAWYVMLGLSIQDAFKRVVPHIWKKEYNKAIFSGKFYQYLFHGLGYMNTLTTKLGERGVTEDSVADLVAEHLFDRTSSSHKWALQLAVNAFFDNSKPQQTIVTVNNMVSNNGTSNRVEISNASIESELATLLPNQHLALPEAHAPSVEHPFEVLSSDSHTPVPGT